jgi:alanine racemase
MPQYNLNQLAQMAGGQIVGTGNPTIRHLITDSRNIVFTTDSIFFALKGERHDGHKFVSDLYSKKGLKNFIVEEIDPKLLQNTDINFIIVNNSLKALQNIAIAHRNSFQGNVIGITGSNGKTIVKEWLYQLLHQDFNIVRSPKSYNSQIGVPLSVWNLEAEAELAIFEAGISKHDEMIKLQPIINPQIGLFTNIGEAHQENFLSIQRKVREKLCLFRDVNTLIYCADHDFISEEIGDWVNTGQQIITWSEHKKANLQIISIAKNNRNSLIEATYNGNLISINIPFSDAASIENAIHCWLMLLFLGIDSTTISLRMQNLVSVAMRLELINGINNCTIINDSYNSDVHSLSIALDFLNQQQQNNSKTLILSDILQSGKDKVELYSEVARLVENKQINKLIGIGPALYNMAHLFHCEKYFHQSTNDFLNQLHVESFQNETILLKGARNFEFERILPHFEQKAHRTILEINLSSMIHNLNYFRSKLKPATKIIVMVKAFSYGSGSYEIANMLEYQKVDYLAVAFADEGVALRQAGISIPIIVMNPEETSFRLMIDYRLEPEIYSFSELEKFTQYLHISQILNFPIHIKIDTGMHRLGFVAKEIPLLCNQLKLNKYISIQSVFSHLAASDEPALDDFTELQVTRFEEMSNEIAGTVTYPILKHILNSQGIERFSKYQFDMVRLGIGLYGINPFNQNQLQNVSTFKTFISQIKTVEVGETIGYNRKGKIVSKTIIAVIPVGYADGFNRKLGNGIGKVFINGTFAPVIGNICMDMCMVNITNIKANEGDVVEIFGNNITITEIADQINTIPYEILTSISARVKRIYIQE